MASVWWAYFNFIARSEAVQGLQKGSAVDWCAVSPCASRLFNSILFYLLPLLFGIWFWGPFLYFFATCRQRQLDPIPDLLNKFMTQVEGLTDPANAKRASNDAAPPNPAGKVRQ